MAAIGLNGKSGDLMSLGIYLSQDPKSKVTATKPFTITFDGTQGGSIDKCVYIRNDDPMRYYDTIVVSTSVTSGENITDGSKSGWEWKLLEKSVRPVQLEWERIAAGNQITLTNGIGSNSIPDTSTYLPVWVHVEIPRSQRAQTITRVVVNITATEYLVE